MAQGGKQILGAFILIIGLLIPGRSFADDNVGLHFGLSALFGAASESVLHYKTKLGTVERILYGTALGSIPGLAKELIDSGQDDNHFSGTDMAADVAGALVGAVLANIINDKIQVDVDPQEKKATVSLMYEF